MTPKAEETLLSLHQMLEEVVDIRAKLRAYELACSGLPDSVMTSESLAVRIELLGILHNKGWEPPELVSQRKRQAIELERLLRGVLAGAADSVEEAQRHLGRASPGDGNKKPEAPPHSEPEATIHPWSRW